eukprot:Gb_05535 [translate_table: standard]
MNVSGFSSSSSSSDATVEVQFARCKCCGLTEECTPDYIARVSERFYGVWICGLCAEAVKEEVCRAKNCIGMEEALRAHMAFCTKFREFLGRPGVESPSVG